MIDLGQETGRGGRDGQPAECITIFWPEILEGDWLNEDARNEVLRWVRDMGCRRLAIGEYLSGSRVDCLSLRNAQHCHQCEDAGGKEGELVIRLSGSLGRRRSSGALLEAKEVRDGADLRHMIAELRGRYPVCFFAGRRTQDKHEFHKCRYEIFVQSIADLQTHGGVMFVLSQQRSCGEGLCQNEIQRKMLLHVWVPPQSIMKGYSWKRHDWGV